MRLAIIGAGSVGGTLGQAWLKHGEDVVWGLRNANDPKYAALPSERVKPPAEAVEGADIVVIATPWSATEAVVKSLGSLAGKVVIDCTNPLGYGSRWTTARSRIRHLCWRAGRKLGTGRFRLQVSQHDGRKQYGQCRRLSGEAAHAGGR